MTDERTVRAALARVADLETEAKAILATHEASSERVITLEGSYAKLDGMSMAQGSAKASVQFDTGSIAQPMCSPGRGSLTSCTTS